MSAGIRPTPAWLVAEPVNDDDRSLAEQCGLPPLIGLLLRQRGATTYNTARRFLEPSAEFLASPYDLPDLPAAIDRITQARDNHENVLVFGDYDVDGVTGTAILLRALRAFGVERCAVDLPSRFEDGYGLSEERVREAHAKGVSLIIAVDNGTRALGPARTAQAQGMDFIVADHHTPGDELPPAAAIVNPQLLPSGHPSRGLCGSSVAFKLAWALTGEMRDIDLAALGTIADMVPLEGENRDLAAAGIESIRVCPRFSLEALGRSAGVRLSALTSEDIAFRIGPRLNAAGRLGKAQSALQLLLSTDATDALRLARILEDANRERRRIEEELVAEAEIAAQEAAAEGLPAIVLAGRGWHPGVLGIAAAKLVNRYHRPVLLAAINEDGLGRGSARSVPGVNITAMLGACAHTLVRHGGHEAAAGFTFEASRYADFKAAVCGALGGRFEAPPSPPPLKVDAIAAFSEIDGHLLRGLDRLEPFGQANPAPVFCTFGVNVLENSCRIVGQSHLRLALQHGPALLQAIGFGMGDLAGEVEREGLVDVAYTPKFNTWRGETTIQLNLHAIRPAQEPPPGVS